MMKTRAAATPVEGFGADESGSAAADVDDGSVASVVTRPLSAPLVSWPEPTGDRSGSTDDLATLEFVERALDPAVRDQLPEAAQKCRERASFHGTGNALGAAWLALAAAIDALGLGGLDPTAVTPIVDTLRRTLGRAKIPAERAKRRFWR